MQINKKMNDMTNKDIIAAIDIGTNSFHIVIAKTNPDGTISLISHTKEVVRLGESGDEMKHLSKEAMERGLSAMKHFAEYVKIHNPQIRAIATCAVREAINGKEFIDLIKQETGIEIEIVSGSEEGRLAYLGVLYGIPIIDKRALIIDIGGGSTETVVGFQGNILFSNSEKLGAIRLTKRFFHTEINAKTIEECRKYIAGKLTPIFTLIKNFNLEEVIGTAGTIETIAFMANLKKNKDLTEVTISNNGFSVSINGMLEIIDKIVAAKTPQAINELNGMDKKRADIILAGALIIEFILLFLRNNFGIKKILFSPYGLREGILYDTAVKNTSLCTVAKLRDLRRNTIDNLAKKLNINYAHAKQVEIISLKIFDLMNQILFEFGDDEREMLAYAALLHDIGYFISHDLHHKHSFYLIKNSDLPGFTNDDANLIANIARYHRKSHPKKIHNEYTILSDSKKYIVKVLAGILRIAEGLDRRQNQFVKDVAVDFDKASNDLNIRLVSAEQDSSIDI